MKQSSGHQHRVLPEVPSLTSGKPPLTSAGQGMGCMLILCAIATLAAFITVCCRHIRFDYWGIESVPALLSMLTFYVIPIFIPLALLTLSLYLKRNVSPLRAMLLIFPIGCAFGCLLMCTAPADNHDGEILGYGILTVIWGLISIPFCCIPFLVSEKRDENNIQ